MVHDAPRMNFQVFASGGAEAVTRVIYVALSEQLSTAVINGKYQQEPGCGLFNTVENGETSSVLLPASALQHMSLF